MTFVRKVAGEGLYEEEANLRVKSHTHTHTHPPMVGFRVLEH